MPSTSSSADPIRRHRLEARLLGGMSLYYNGQSLPETAFRRRKSLIILLRLLIEPTHRLPVDDILELLWPDQDPRSSAANLRSVLSGIRAALPDHTAPNPVVRLDSTLAIDPTLELLLDVDQFEAAAGSGLIEDDPAALRQALTLYTGSLLPSLPYEEWVTDRRTALGRLHRKVVLTLAADGKKAAEERLYALLADDRADEQVGQALLRLLGAQDRKVEALRVHQALVAALQEELGVAPSRETDALHAALLQPSVSPIQPAKLSEEAPHHNLPAALSSFIGRAWERAELRQVLERSRLLTLTGPGGCGKTRLALALAEERRANFPDGVWLVELAAVGSEAAVIPTVAGALGLREQPECPLSDTLVTHLAAGTSLLLLDNCEHLLDACARLVDTLSRSCPTLHILATSRERLGLTGEAVRLVPPLSLPGEEAERPGSGATAPAQLAQSEAVQLFVERVRGVRSGFALTTLNAAAVAQVCRRLDGIPLALELAAARVGVLGVEELARRLDDRFRLLTGGSRAALPRQQTLRASMDWSYELLSEGERLLLARLSVFVGGWTLEAAEAVGVGSGIEVNTALDLLDGLVSKSLVSAHEQAGGETRYGLLETVRQYAGERLAEMGDTCTARDRHLDWCLALAERAEPEVKGPGQGEWLARLEIEHDNLQAALGWAHERGAGDLGLRLAGALSGFWYMRGHFTEGRRRLAAALADDSRGSPGARAKALNGAGLLAHQQSDYNQANALFEESLALRRGLGDNHGIAQSLNNLGMTADEQGDYERAAIFYEESLAIARALGDKWAIAVSLDNLGLLADEQGHLERAVALHEESLNLRRELGDRLGVAGSLGNLGLCMQRHGDYQRAMALHEESLVIRRELGQRWAVAIALGNLGVTAYRQGDYERAATFYRESLVIDRELGSHLGIADSLGGLGWVAYRQGDLPRAFDLFAESLRLSDELGTMDFQAEVLEGLAWVAGANGQPRRAAQLGGAAEALRELLGTPLMPFMRDGHDRMLRDIGSVLETDACAHLWNEGHMLSTEQAIALALSPHPDPETAPTG